MAAGRETIQVPDKESATYAAGFTMKLTDRDPDYVALEMGNYLLGGSSTSRLWDRLRQKEGYSYSVGRTVASFPERNRPSPPNRLRNSRPSQSANGRVVV